MWIEIFPFGFLSLFASTNAMLIGLASLFRRPGQTRRSSAVRFRFSLLLICVGYLLALFTLIHFDIVTYSGLLRLSHDIVSLFFALLLLDYVRCSLQLKTFGVWLTLLPGAYFFSWILLGEHFLARIIEVEHLILFGVACTALSVATYLHSLSRSVVTAEPIRRVPLLEVLLTALIAFYLTQIFYLADRNNLVLYLVAPQLGTLFIFLYFVLFIFLPGFTDRFLTPAPFSPNSGTSDTFNRVAATISDQELFADTDLNIDTLADKLGLKPRFLSQLINMESGGNFYQFINRFRVTKARELLDSNDEPHTSIEAIALLCGFKSRSSFYEAFRRETGLSPGQYRIRPR